MQAPERQPGVHTRAKAQKSEISLWPQICGALCCLPVTWKLSRSLVTLTVEGHVNDDLRRAIIEAMASPDFPADPAVLLDTRQAAQNQDPDELRLHAGWIAYLLSRRPSSRCAVVVTARPQGYGLAQILSVFLGTEGIQCKIFTAVAEARKWLIPAENLKLGGVAT